MKEPVPSTEIYGPRSEYGFLRTTRRPIRMRDSLKPCNNNLYTLIYVLIIVSLLTIQLHRNCLPVPSTVATKPCQVDNPGRVDNRLDSGDTIHVGPRVEG